MLVSCLKRYIGNYDSMKYTVLTLHSRENIKKKIKEESIKFVKIENMIIRIIVITNDRISCPFPFTCQLTK